MLRNLVVLIVKITVLGNLKAILVENLSKGVILKLLLAL
jgi:hypothetical protein